jgi:putative membrane protein
MAQDDPAPPDADQSTKWAEFRTDLAEDRNIMAMERTFAGWMRTAFAAIGIGLGFRALFGAWDPVWVPKLIASLFILGGGWLAVTAQRRACKTLERLDTHEFSPISTPNFRTMAYGVAAGAVVVTIGLWVLVDEVVPPPGGEQQGEAGADADSGSGSGRGSGAGSNSGRNSGA